MPLDGIIHFTWRPFAKVAMQEIEEALCGRSGSPFVKLNKNAFGCTRAPDAIVMAALKRLASVLADRGQRLDGIVMTLHRSATRAAKKHRKVASHRKRRAA